MKIAILGTRGIPACYGGFETLAEELGARLSALGHEVTVYGRSHYVPPDLAEHRGVQLAVLPTIRTKYLDTVLHGLLSAVHAATKDYDAILFCNAINAAVCWIPRVFGRQRVLLNVDGLEKNRRKWGRAGRMAYALSERLSTLLPDRIVTDAEVIRSYYRQRYGVESTMIAYGGDLPVPGGDAQLARLGLESERYVLYVSRIEPENNADAVVRAYRDVPGQMPLVVVGDAPYARDYIASVKQLADPRVLFPGAIYGEGYRQLLSRALVYIQATEVGGTHPALVEALGYGRIVLYHDSPENREVAAGAGLPFDVHHPESLAEQLSSVLNDPSSFSVWKEEARLRVADRYRWSRIVEEYEKAFRGIW
jgi:glycosyltransferase involved in cell wall biosynthesis